MNVLGSIIFNPLVSGGGGTETGLTDEQVVELMQAAARINAVPGEPDTPLDLIPAYTPPTGLIRVLFRPTKMKQLVDRDAQVFYVDQVPLVDGSIEMVKEGSSFEKDEAVFGPTFKGLIMPLGDSVFRSAIPLAAMDTQTKDSRFKVVDLHSNGVVFLDELITAYNQ